MAAAQTSSAPATGPADARTLLWTGRYDEAVRAYDELGRQESQRVSAAIGASRALAFCGHYEDALQRLESVGAAAARSPDWLIARAEALRIIGRLDEAIAEAARAVEIDPTQATARRLLGELYEEHGDRDRAVEQYAWFEAVLRRGLPPRASAMTDAGIALARHTALTHPADAVQRTRRVLQELFQTAYGRVDKRYWPARLAAADLLLSKYNLDQAAEDYRAALAVNPKLADAHVGLGLIALEGWRFEETEKHIAGALAANPRHAGAHRLKAKLHLTERKFDDARQAAEESLKTNAGDLEALGLLASAHLRSGDAAAARAVGERAASIRGRHELYQHELGTWLAGGRQFPEAEKHFQRAIELAPHWPQPRNALGMMYMETGAEADARRTLEASWKLDPYNAETRNVLELLDRLDRFGRDESEHFIILSDEVKDGPIRADFAAFLESIYPEVCQRYGGEPAAKTMVEIFPEHHAFAVRITGKPWIHTIGACTGRVIAMDAPRADAGGGPFNWADVLRHEFTHTVTLAATENRIPHWLTEALAVRSERATRPWDWCRLLAHAVRRDRLFDLTSIDWAFARPKRPDDRILAYAQSEWMLEYLVERTAETMIGRMLQAFRAGRRQEEVFRDVVGVPQDAFVRDFRAWAARQAASWNLGGESIPTVEELERRIREQTGDRAHLQGLLVQALLDDYKVDRVRAVLREIPEESRDIEVLRARMLWAMVPTSRPAGPVAVMNRAAKWAALLAEVRPDDPGALHVLSEAALEDSNDPEATRWLERLRRAAPRDPLGPRGIAQLREKAGDTAGAIAAYTALAELDRVDRSVPLKLAELLTQAEKQTEAAQWLRRALQIDPYATATRGQLAGVFMKTRRYGEAAREYELLTRIAPQKPAYHSDLAFAYQAAGDLHRAQAAARRAVAFDPESPAKKLLGER